MPRLESGMLVATTFDHLVCFYVRHGFMPHLRAASALCLAVLLADAPVGAQSAPAKPAAATAPVRRPVRAEALPTKVDYVPQGRYDDLRNWVIRSKAEGGTLFNSPDGQTNYMMERRTTPSDVEEHSRWDDVIIVRSGAGTVEVGPRTKGARFMAAGELRGGKIMAPSTLELRPGDITRIPAGIPHAFTPVGSEPWEFLIIKVRRPNKPLKRPPDTTK
jgi:mannose-6-phosphate isomerase-like protein (cupin superfamily)